MSRFYITGGRQRRRGPWVEEWHRYDKGIIAELDSQTGRIERRVEHVTPAEAAPRDEDPAILFKAATLEGDLLYVCTQTEVMVYELPDFRRRSYLSLPCFNDVHHVRPTARGSLLVVSTGLDMVLELTGEGARIREWNVLGEGAWERFSEEIDYRQVLTTQPHAAHPNYVFTLGEEIWVSRLHQRDAICLTAPGRFDVAIESVHDGIVSEGRVYFTTVDGHIVVFDATSRERVATHDLNRLYDLEDDTVIGWCRGLEVLSPDKVVVGFSRLRQTSLSQNLRRLKSRALGSRLIDSLPTRVAGVDLARGVLEWEHELEDAELNAVFSIHAADPD